MPFSVIAEGFVARIEPGPGAPLAVGPRTAQLPSGEIVCSYMLNSALGINDFVPMLCRSSDGGVNWSEPVPAWPHLRPRWSIFASISRDPSGRLFLFGSRTPIDRPGEPFWSDATQGLKQNELIWAISSDGGHTWSDPSVIPMPIPGAAEAPGAMCITRAGRWVACYSPYATFDPMLRVERNQVVVVYSDDEGKTWKHASMLRFDEVDSGGAEAWVIELSDGHLLGTCWHINLVPGGGDFPNRFAISEDGGISWSKTRSTGILGQSTALAPISDCYALFIYNQRRHGEPGVCLAVVRPRANDFGVTMDHALIWRAETRTQQGTTGEHAEWGDFSFGEPSVTPLADGTLLVTLWCVQRSGHGIRYVKIRCT